MTSIWFEFIPNQRTTRKHLWAKNSNVVYQVGTNNKEIPAI